MPQTAPFVPGSQTSKEAADSIVPHLTGLRARVYAAIVAAGDEGMTCDEVEVVTGLRHQTASARVRELSKAGLIVKGGRRQTRSGRYAVVYSAAAGA